MKKGKVIGWILLFFFMKGIAGEQTHLHPLNGVLDLSAIDVGNDFYFNLNGEWRFHWEELIEPSNRDEIVERNPGLVVRVPSYWNSYEINGQLLPGSGYGTYRLTIILPEDYHKPLCFDIPVFDVAYTFYLNDWLINSNGEVGRSLEEEKPWYEPSSFCFIPDKDTLELLIQVSNFHHRRGGFWKSIFTGSPDRVLGRMEHQKMYNYSTIGVLFFFFIFYLIFWFFAKWDMPMLLFALTALGILIRSVNTGLYFSNAFLEMPWTWQIRMEYFGSYMAHIFGMMFLNRVFPARYMKQVIRANTLLFTLATLSLFVLPVRVFSYEMLVYQPVLLLFLVYYLIVGFLGTLRGKAQDAIFFLSLGLFIYTLVNDILLANTAGAIHNNYLSQISFQVFILAMAVLVIRQWVQNFNTRLQLESSLRFKNKVLSVIAHDLKNPIASVAQFSELLEEKPELVKESHVINSLKESSQAAVTLLDNLLYWGRSQADELTINPQRFDVAEMVHEVESLYLHMVAQKQIDFIVKIEPGIQAFADRALVNIVVRNLVSNAIKFTPRKGSIQLLIKKEGTFVLFKVNDTGIGIKPEILEQFSENGTMGSSAGTESEVGTGLGLQLVRDLVVSNGGSLQVESVLHQGSSFTFTIPLSND